MKRRGKDGMGKGREGKRTKNKAELFFRLMGLRGFMEGGRLRLTLFREGRTEGFVEGGGGGGLHDDAS